MNSAQERREIWKAMLAYARAAFDLRIGDVTVDPPTNRRHRVIVSVGDRFGKLVVRSKGMDTHKLTCQCDCGRVKVVQKDGLVHGRVLSCGCFRSKRATGLRQKYIDRMGL